MKEVTEGGSFYQWYRILLKYHTQRLKKGANSEQIKWVKKIIPDKNVFFDIGANKGLFSFWVAKFMRNKGSIHIFEPQPELSFIFGNLEKHFSERHTFFYNNFGLSDSEGTANLNRQCIGDGSASFSKLTKSNELSKPVPLQRLDQYCINNDIQNIDFIKIDVEGYEFKVIAGGINTIKKFKPCILMEMTPCDESGMIIEMFREIGYKIKMIWHGNTFEENSQTFEDFESQKRITNFHSDFLFHH